MPSAVSSDTPSGPVTLGYTTQGWRPTSAVIHPVWMAMNGQIGESTAAHCSQRIFAIRPPRNVNTSTRMLVSMMSPYMATMRW